MQIPSISPAPNIGCSQQPPTMVRNLAQTFDMLTHAAETQLGLITESASPWGTAFYLGDGLQRAVADRILDLFRPGTWIPANIWRLSFGALQQALRVSAFLDPCQAALAYQELKNKLEVFALVKNLSSTLQLPPDQLIPLPELVRRAYRVSPFSALWAVEGLGHYYTDLYWKLKGAPHSLLSDSDVQVPQESLLMLHAGMGLAFASRLLDSISPDAASPNQVSTVLREFVSLCENNARLGYLGAAIESLGLVTRDFYPDLLDIIHRQFVEIAPQFIGFFWHGAGRALYFSRRYFLPLLGTVWSGIDEEAHGCPDRQSAMAGLAWAVTLVNMRQPAIMQNVLGSQMAPAPLADAFTNGVISSIIMRQDTTPDAQFIPAFFKYQAHDRQRATIWERRISEPTTLALNTFYPALRQHHALDQVFRYQDLAAVVSSLQLPGTGQSSEEPEYQH